MTSPKRLSQAISEGDGISLIIEVDGPESARAAEGAGAKAVLLYSGAEAHLEHVSDVTSLPVVFHFDDGRAEPVSGADACVVHGSTQWLEQVHGELAQAAEVAIRIDDEDQLEEVLQRFDPEIVLLAGDSDRERLPHVLGLLSDVPAGKLAIADLPGVTPDEIRELERAGCDAVLVGAAHAAG
ncbi:MAG TPA: hypothetical protein VEY87_02950 [Gaiellaceae bacterium]|nr:hypothetical protein [Gaiellaceae bacterium]